MTDPAHLLARAKQVMPPNYAPLPLVAKRALGTTLWDSTGKTYLDFSSGIGVNAVGHCHPNVIAAINHQAGLLCHTANLMLHETYVHLCERLVALSFAEKVFLCNSGTEAMEAALKLTRRYHNASSYPRPVFVATENSFHGRTLGALSITGQTKYREGYEPLLPQVRFIPFGDVGAASRAIDHQVAAVIVEPVQGNAGVIPSPPGYLAALRNLCDQQSALLIFDEIQTGLGRTGHWFAHQHDGVFPDMMTLAKALGGGLPLGAMLTSTRIAEAFSLGSHGSTFGGNPVACAAGLATLDVIKNDALIERSEKLGEELRNAFSDSQATDDAIVAVRGRGLMIGIELQHAAKDVRNRCFKSGLIVTLAGPKTIRLLPPLNTPKSQLHQGRDILLKAIRQP